MRVVDWGATVPGLSLQLRRERRPRLELTLVVLNMATYATAAVTLLAASLTLR